MGTYPSAGMQSAYSTATAHWAVDKSKVTTRNRGRMIGELFVVLTTLDEQ